MSILSRFFGRRDNKDNQQSSDLVANPDSDNGVSLQVVFGSELSIDEGKLEQTLRGFDPSMKQAKCQRDPELGDFFALVGWESTLFAWLALMLLSRQSTWRSVLRLHTMVQT